MCEQIQYVLFGFNDCLCDLIELYKAILFDYCFNRLFMFFLLFGEGIELFFDGSV